jgi:hypothetical protein
MVKRAQKAEAADDGNIGTGRTDHPSLREEHPYGGKKPEPGPEDLSGVFRLTAGKWFPVINPYLRRIPDPRRDHPSKIYPLPYLVWMAMLMFVMQSGSRRQYDLDKDSGAFLLNLLALSECDLKTGRLATAETADDLLQQIDPEHFRGLRKMIVQHLIRSKRLDSCKYGAYWRLAVDATGLYTFRKQHCPYCQTRKNPATGEVLYYHNVLEFKLVSQEGLAISLDSEFISLQDGDSKQDSELKAFHRAAPRIKKDWPCMPFLLLGDGIYANAPVMRTCQTYHWKYCASLKDNLPTLKNESLKRMEKETGISHCPKEGIIQKIRWAEGLLHQDFRCHVVSCVETDTKKGKTTHYLWVTNMRPSRDPEGLVNEAGRQRWKIENQGFNTQKNGGYNIEHGYGVTGNAWQNYYLLVQIVHAIMQMTACTDAIYKLPSQRDRKTQGRPPPLLSLFKSMKNFVKRLSEAFRYCPPTWTDVSELGLLQLRYLNTT